MARMALRLLDERTLDYSGSCLPETMLVAKTFRRMILPHLRSIPPTWPFEDRVLAWLSRGCLERIKRFHNGAGSRLAELLPEEVLQRIDAELLAVLLQRLDNAVPGLKSLLTSLLLGPSNAGTGPPGTATADN
jgi:hypothetical protein